MEIGIYIIKNTANSKIYIGSSNHLLHRWNQHKCLLRKDKHPNNKLQNGYNKYGEDVFTFTIVENCDADKLIEREQCWIDLLEPWYNIDKIAGPGNTSLKGKPWSEARRAVELNRPEGWKRAKYINRKKPKPHSPETREKQRQAALNRKPITEETREKLRKAKLGNQNRRKKDLKI